MKKLKHTVMILTLAVIVLLIVFSIYTAFLNPQAAQDFFNSTPLAFFWFFFLFILAAGIFLFRSLRRPVQFLIHAGCIAILAGAFWGSQTAHSIFRPDKVHKGIIAIYQGQAEDRVFIPDANQIVQLPFEIKLNDFRVDYYGLPVLIVQNRQGQTEEFRVQPGKQVSLNISPATITILKTFDNFKITFEENKSIPIESDSPGSNPALQVMIEDPNGLEKTQYVFERFGGYFDPDHDLKLSYYTYHRNIRRFVSDVEIIRNGKVLAEKSIMVNHPMYFGGYHLYQYRYDSDNFEHTVLLVVSNSGVTLVYLGFIMLGIGIFWNFWFIKALRKK